MPKIFNHNASILARRLDALYNGYDWKLENTHKYSIFFDKIASVIDNTEQMNIFNGMLHTWVARYGMPIKVFEMHLQNISYSVYQGGKYSGKKLKRKITTKDLTGFPIIKTVEIDWYTADQNLSLIVNWCYAVLNKMAYDYDVDTKSIYRRDNKRY